MAKNINEEITTHLEFVGYKIESNSDDDTPISSFLARSEASSNSNFFVNINNSRSIFMARWGTYQGKAIKSSEFHNVINGINLKSVTKWYYEVDESNGLVTIVVEADYYGYEKVSFGSFVEMFNTEVIKFLPELNDFRKQDDEK